MLIRQTKTFFFYNFPENCEEKELWFSFQRCGKVLDVYVPKKRDKWGKRFGFLRMLGVQNDNQMVRRLNDIWFGSYKLRVKIAEERSNTSVKDKGMADRKQHREDRMVKPGQSYAQVVKGKNQSFQGLPDRTGSLEGEDMGIIQKEKESFQARQLNRKEEVASCDILVGKKGMVENRMVEPQKEIMEFTPEQEENQWLEGGLVAVVKSLSVVKDVQQRIDVDGGLITISPLGGRKVLLSEHKPGYLLEFMNHNKELFSLWFEDIQPWDKQVQDRSRMAWLRINEHKISKQIDLKVEGKWYEIQVVEEEWRSDPDWWLSDDDRRSVGQTAKTDRRLLSRKGHGASDIKDAGAKSNTKRHQRGKADLILGAASQVNMLGNCSISDGCIAFRNNIIRKELTLHERREVGKLVRMEQPDFLWLQETKLEKVDDNLCRMMWDSREFGWVMKESIGASGGLLCFWNKENFTKTGDSTGDGYLRISGEWGIHKMKYNLVNVYGPNDRQKRLKLWDELRIMITEEGGRWLIAGDFNAVRCLEERRGRTGESPDMKDFDVFIQSARLIDIKMANRFTWYRLDGTAMSRLDRVLMNVEMYSMSAEWVQQGLKRNISDHCAIVLKTRTVDWGPRPFRVLDAWQLHPNFKKVIEEKWSTMEVDGFAGYKCKQKLKKLKEFLKGWNRDVFGDMEAQYEQAVKKVEHVDLKNEDFDLDEFEILHRQEGFQNMWDILRKREVMWRQKSRSNWVREGDANTRFFHRIANGRKAQNLITGLWCDGVWVEEPIQVKKEVVNYFSKLFQGDTWNRPKPQGLNTGNLKDYRPISLIGCIYKLLSKVLANRLKAVLPGIISETQSAFLGGRQLVDGVLVLNEVVEEVKRRKQSAFIFKADFAKAYDCVDWTFLEWMMDRLGFGIKWRGWIMECLSTTRMSVLINGNPTEEFKAGKGLRQGDPLSPFLFLMIGEGLNGLVQKAVSEDLLRGIEIGRRGLAISLLQYADDTIIMGKAVTENIFMVKTILRWFELMSGLQN
ncbi:hypothetical protein SLEP1_g49166 [Rubroshorea leprosula]|uniref:Reverse transcriptase domain-containing protein n=1 Tax=Rubroshorea leprosula TaxID=152421 RepID=A0AAV5LYF3_9ROSI|nr:hypothetical protein SLEP1_g49166 [Rubroshorea leprosula]